MARKPLLVGVSGGTASGKTTVCRIITEALGVNCVLISMDNFYRGLTAEEHEKAADYNFDHPNALDFDELHHCLCSLLAGQATDIPVYDFSTHARTSEHLHLEPADLILFEGIFSLYEERIRDLMSLKIFVQTDDDVRLARRLTRDTRERGRTVPGIITQYMRFVKPAYEGYIQPTMKHADIILPNGAQNKVGIGLIIEYLQNRLRKP